MPDIFLGKSPSIEVAPQLEDDVIKEQEITTKEEFIKPKIRHTRPSAFSAYKESPSNINLSDILDEEEMLLFLRRHFVTNFIWILNSIILSVIPLIFYLVYSLGFFEINFIPSIYIIFGLIFYYFFILSGYVFVHLLTWFYNVSIVTNARIIDIDFASLVFENVDATTLSQVEDVGYSQIGIVRSIFDYGDVTIQTAGATTNFEFLGIPHPERVVKIVHDLMGKKKNE